MFTEIHPESVMGRIIARVADSRSRRGRMYYLPAILGMLLLGALEGEGSLRGVWMRGRKYCLALARCLGVEGLPRPPALTTTWHVLQRVDARQLGAAWHEWMGSAEEPIVADGKHLRGSRRAGKEALRVLSEEQVQEHIWMTSAPIERATPRQVQEWLRGHWAIENGVFRVRDVSYAEDWLHGRKIGPGLSALRNGALNVIRRMGYRHVPDAWRELSSRPWLPSCLFVPLSEL